LPANAVERLAEELAEVAGTEVELERPSDPGHGDYATNVALRTAPVRKRSPREVAEELAGGAMELDSVERAEVAGPGFLNLWLTRDWYSAALAEVLGAGDSYGAGSAATHERIQVELVSANPTGPVTVASARNGAYGDSVARLLEFAGHSVEREFYVNDTGTQIEAFEASIQAIRADREPPENGYTGAYMAEVAVQEDPIAFLLESIERTLERFRIPIDSWVRQSSMEPRIPAAIDALETYTAEGALWVRTSLHGDEKDRVLIRSQERGGKPAYVAWDAAYLRHKLERGFDRLIYVLGADHHGYVGRLKGLAGAFGYDPDRIEILIYQLVHLVERGEARKMSKRRGDTVFLDDLMDAIGVDASRWYLVSRGHDQPIDIDVDLAAERSQKNPVYYVQYAHARIAGILRNAGDAAVGGPAPGVLAVEERDLIKRLAEFPGVAAEATERRAPHAIPVYAIRVADDFHRFYHEHRVIDSEAEAFRLGLCRATQTVIARCLDLVGVEAPERM
jgi:arginyl-tRNA synthetase